jgi:hypothetical protein
MQTTTPAGLTGYQAYEDTSFVTGDSPATHDFNADSGRQASDGYIVNDGPGTLTFALSADGTNYGDEITIKAGEKITLTGVEINKLRTTWVSNTAYRILLN